MKTCLWIVILVITLVGTASLQEGMRVPPAPSLESYRPVGEARLWSFEIKTQNVGTLVSTVTRKTKFEDQPAYVINEKLTLDFHPAGSDVTIQITGDQYVSPQGYYLGSEQEQSINNQPSTLKASRKGSIIEAVTKAGDEESRQSIVLDQSGYAYDLFFLDQLELYFAMHGLQLGATYSDTLFSPQPMLTTVFNGLVFDYKWQGLYTGHFDSVFVVNVSLPEPCRLYITKNFRLVKADFLNRNLKVYLDAVRQTAAASQTAYPKFTLTRFFMLIPIIGIYLTIVGLLLMLLGWDGFKLEEPYIALLIGAILYAVVPLVQFSFQNWMVRGIVAPSAQSGAIWGTALLVSLTAGVLQTILIAGALLVLRKFPRIRALSPVVIGSFIGAGFGVAEAAYLAFNAPVEMLLTWGLLDRASFIILHTASGRLIGHGLAGGSRKLAACCGIVVAVNTVMRYAPILAQQKILHMQLIYILLGLIALLFLGLVLIFTRYKRPAKVTPKPAKQPAV